MSEEEGKSRGFVGGGDHHHQQQQQYGTFPANFPSYPQPVIGFPQQIPLPGVGSPSPSALPYYSHGYQAVPVYAVAEGRPVRECRRLCCGIGIGWWFFITGFFLAAIPWYVAAIILLCVRTVDYREKPGLIACTIAAGLSIIAVILGVTKGTHDW